MIEHTIVLKGKGHHEEGVLDGAASPGMAVTLDADGKYTQPAAATAEEVKGGLKIVKEDALQGKTIDNAYASGDHVFLYEPLPGDHIGALVKSGQTIALGDELVIEAGGSGLWIEAAGTEARYRLEALEGPGLLAANTHVKARVL